MPGQAKDWCFTVKAEARDELKALEDQAKYIVIGLEEGDGGYVHYQGFVQLVVKKSLNDLKKGSPTAHLEMRKGTPQEAADYCKKDKVWFEWGKLSSQGERSDIAEFVEAAKVLPRAAMYESHPACMVRYNRSYGDIQACFERPDPNPLPIIWFTGESKQGKSSIVEQYFGTIYNKPNEHAWWDGYSDQETVHIAEITPLCMPFSLLLKLADPGVRRVNTKGATAVLRAKRIVITSNESPLQVYLRETAFGPHFDALTRRVAVLRVQRVADGVSRAIMQRIENGRYVDTDDYKDYKLKVYDWTPSIQWLP